MPDPLRLSIVIPTLDEGARLERTLSQLQSLRSRGHQVIVVDGGSVDDTVSIAKGQVDRVITSPKGRSRQMNAGACQSNGDVLLFLHADTFLPEGADDLVTARLRDSASGWGRFDVRLSPRPWPLPVVELLMNWRSRLTGIATGDRAIFVTRELFDRVGGYADVPLMEDVNLSRNLRSISTPLCIRQRVITSSRRWLNNGILRTVLTMWHLRFCYALGADPRRLHNIYQQLRS